MLKLSEFAADQALSTTPHPDLQSTPFLEYSSLYWGIHAKMDLSDYAKMLTLKLFEDYNNHISAKILAKAQARYSPSVDFGKPSLFSGLHCASIFGIDEIVASLVEVDGCDINQIDCAGNTPLIWAVRNGHEGVVRILLGQDDVNPGKPALFEKTPLCFAAERGHEEVVKILLERDDVNPNKRDTFWETPLSFAAYNGHEGVVKILLGRDDVNPDSRGFLGGTPLYWGAEKGHEGVVKILLERDDVNPNKPDKKGRTPLSGAVKYGRTGVIALLQPLAPTTPSTTLMQRICALLTLYRLLHCVWTTITADNASMETQLS